VLSFLGFTAALFATLPIVSEPAHVFGTDHLVQMAAWPVVWGTLSTCAVLLAARLVFGKWLRVTVASLLVAGLGIGLAAAVNYVLQRWELQRFGLTEPEFVGITAGLFAVLVGVAVAAFGVLVAQRPAAIWPYVAVVAGGSIALLIVFSNVPGLRDGIEIESWWLAVCVGGSALYLVATLVITTLHVRRGLLSRDSD
jgi:Na+-transporting NADH:ubiquinone oxidoreductase subunit NqrB